MRKRSLLKSLSIDKENRRENSTYYNSHVTQAGLMATYNIDHMNNIMQAFSESADEIDEACNGSMIVVPVQEKFPSFSSILKH